MSNWVLHFLLFGAKAPQWARVSSFTRFVDHTHTHTQRRTTVGRTPLDEWSACYRDLYLTTHNTRNRQTSMPPVIFEPTISAGERPKTYALDRAATGTGNWLLYRYMLIVQQNAAIGNMRLIRWKYIWKSVGVWSMLKGVHTPRRGGRIKSASR